MKRISSLVLVVVIMVGLLPATTASTGTVTLSTGVEANVLIAPTDMYSWGERFGNGLARVIKNDGGGSSYGYVDMTGTVKIDFIYEWGSDFVDGLAIVEKTGTDNVFFIGPAGNETATKYSSISRFPNGLMLGYYDSKYDLLNYKGNVIIDDYKGYPYSEGLWQYVSAIRFNEDGLARVHNDRLQGYIDREKVVVPIEYDSVWGPRADGVYVVYSRNNDEDISGLVNKNGQVLIQMNGYFYFGMFNNGLALVRGSEYENGQWVDKYGYINSKGEWAIPLGTYKAGTSFSDGEAIVQATDGKWHVITAANPGAPGQQLTWLNADDYVESYTKGTLAVYNNNTETSRLVKKDGTIVVASGIYDYIGEAEDDGSGLLYVEAKVGDEYQWGLLDHTGKVVLPLGMYDDIELGGEYCENGVVMVEIDGKVGLTDLTGKLIIEPTYDDIYYEHIYHGSFDGLFWVELDGKTGMIDIKTGKIIVPLGYNFDSYGFVDGIAAVYCVDDDNYGLLRRDGTWLVEPGNYECWIEEGNGGLMSVWTEDKETKEDYVYIIDSEGYIVAEAVTDNDKYEEFYLSGQTSDGKALLWHYKEDAQGYTLSLISIGNYNQAKLKRFSGVPGTPSGIDYTAPDVIVPGIGADGFFINLSNETITIPTGYSVAAFSIDGDKKWKAAKPDTFSAANFAKMLNKDLILYLSDKPLDSKTKKPAEGAVIVTFPKINKRPTALKLVVNYEIASDATGATSGEWVLTAKNGTTAVKTDIQIGLALNKTVDANGYGQFFTGAANGISVKALTGAKTEKTAYFIRTAPIPSDSGYTAAGKAKKISVTGEQKKPNYKVNAKDEKKNKDGSVKTPATAIIKIKADTYVSINGEAPTLYTQKTEINVLNVVGTIELWQAATAKKSASAKQIITR